MVKGPIRAQAAGKRNIGRALVGFMTAVLRGKRTVRPEFDDNDDDDDVRGWSENFSASTIDGNTIFTKLVYLS